MDEFQKAVLDQLKALAADMTDVKNDVSNLKSDMADVKNTLARVESEQNAQGKRLEEHTRQLDVLFDAVVDVRERLSTKADRIKAI